MAKKKTLVQLLVVLVVALAAGAGGWWLRGYSSGLKIGLTKPPQQTQQQVLTPVETTANVKEAYDVIVVGTDPEGVAAAVSAARNGMSTLLIDSHDRSILGGLMTVGWLNSLDHNYDREKKSLLPGQKEELLNKGIFSEWYDKVEGDSFDITTAANAFYSLVHQEKNIDLVLKAKQIDPVVTAAGGSQASRIEGINVVTADGKTMKISAKTVIDATQDGDIAAASGVPYTFGREDLGDKKSRMAVTLVFRLKNVTPEVWQQVIKRMNDDGDPGTGANQFSAWGYGEMQKYPAVDKERVKMRGLNIGRQNDNTMLINALQIFGIDGTDAASRQSAFEIGKKELPHVIDYMKKLYPEFAGLELDDTAPELYVRETRHIQGEYRLTMIDLLENRDQWDRIGFGSYPVDIQRISPADNGAVVMQPTKYAVPLRSIVPLKVDGLLVVGKAASFDTLPHGSARVIPVGMAAGQAAGAAAKLVQEKNMTFRELTASKADVELLQKRLNEQGMVLEPYTVKPQPYMQHKAYEGLKAVVSMGLVIGGYNNDFQYEEPSNVKRMENLLNGTRKVHAATGKLPGDPAEAGKALNLSEDAKKTPPLTLEQAAFMITTTLGWNTPAGQAVSELEQKGFLTNATVDGIADKQKLLNSDTYMLLKDLTDAVKGQSK
ncbi:FAD-dependent oxidoreductase [Paenibacillus sp. y28]|uniref:FAD-dependent oxidoreductase n=1 Tax=Paenibacillus sp. y28 TaxID=3129110 RepID=UPI003019C97F